LQDERDRLLTLIDKASIGDTNRRLGGVLLVVGGVLCQTLGSVIVTVST
jgi:hypothetical protein